MTRTDVKRAPLILGSALVAVAVAMFTLIDGRAGYTLLKGAMYGSSSHHTTSFLVSMIVLAVLGVAVLIFGAGMKTHGRQ